MPKFLHLLLQVVLVLQIAPDVSAENGRNPRNSIPRSTSGLYSRNSDQEGEVRTFIVDRPPWNPSPRINSSTGFLLESYERIPGEWESETKVGGKHQNHKRLKRIPVQIRQVPGDGNCLFHSISTCWAYVVNRTHFDYTEDPLDCLYRLSSQFRQQAVDCLRRRRLLFLQGKEYLRTNDLVEAAAAQYGITAEEYCDLMEQDSYWGGGPEIVALCNVLKRPIHVYELISSTEDASLESRFLLRRMACFGSPKFDKKQPLHILSADSRFPDITPGKQLAAGNHFLAVFPMEDPLHESKTKKKKKHLKSKVRGGGSKEEGEKERWLPSPFGRNVDTDIGGRSGSQQSKEVDSDQHKWLAWLKGLLGPSSS